MNKKWISPRNRNNRSNTNPRRAMRRLGTIENLETRKLLTASGFATDLTPIEDVGMAEVASPQATGADRVQRIVNGVQTSDFKAVGIVDGGCSGTLIAPNAVLTAAHCVGGGNMDFELEGQSYSVKQAFVHPRYESDDIDLAVLILDNNVEGIDPIDISRTAPQVGQMLTLVGFGGTGTPQEGHNGDFGVKHVGQTPIDDVNANQIRWDFDNANEANTAPGDSGGPAFITVNNQLLLAGVTSGGYQENAGLGDTSFDTRVDTFASWIDDVLAGNVEETNTGGGGDNGSDDSGSDNGDDVGDEFDNDEAETLAREELAEFDTNNDGSLSRGELAAELESFGYTTDEAREEVDFLLEDFDSDRNGSLDLSELIVSWGGEDNSFDGSDESDMGDDIDDGGDQGNDVIDDEFDDVNDEDSGMDDIVDEASAEELAQEELTEFDANHNGELSEQELGMALESYGYTPDEAEEEAVYLVEEFDADGNGELSLSELVTSYGGEAHEEVDDSQDDEVHDCGSEGEEDDFEDVGEEDDFDDESEDTSDQSPEDLARGELNAFDANGNGELSAQEMASALENYGYTEDEAAEEAEYLVEDFDADGNGELNLSELTASYNDKFFGSDEGDIEEDWDDWDEGDWDDIQRQASDVNRDGATSPIDALLVVNHLNGQGGSDSTGLDVNGDGQITPIDALQIINRMNANSGTAKGSSPSFESDVNRDEDTERVDAVFASLANGDLL